MKKQILLRTGRKGQFVKYPSDWEDRMPPRSGRRFATKCDLLIGLCACGNRHTEGDVWTRDSLQRNRAEIESLEDWKARTG